jgi:ABC-2 type transport system permease protein
MFENAIENNTALDITGMLNRFVAQIDWAQMGGGIIVAALLVYAASEYRRRVVLT